MSHHYHYDPEKFRRESEERKREAGRNAYYCVNELKKDAYDIKYKIDKLDLLIEELSAKAPTINTSSAIQNRRLCARYRWRIRWLLSRNQTGFNASDRKWKELHLLDLSSCDERDTKEALNKIDITFIANNARLKNLNQTINKIRLFLDTAFPTRLQRIRAWFRRSN